MPLSRYDSLLIAIAEGTQAFIELGTYKRANTALKVEVMQNELVIAKEQEKSALNRRLSDSLMVQARMKDEIISTQKNTIKKLGTRPKMWTVSVGAGYGYGFSTEVRRMPFAGIFIGRTLFKF